MRTHSMTGCFANGNQLQISSKLDSGYLNPRTKKKPNQTKPNHRDKRIGKSESRSRVSPQRYPNKLNAYMPAKGPTLSAFDSEW